MRVGYQRNWQATGLASRCGPGSLFLIPSAQSSNLQNFKSENQNSRSYGYHCQGDSPTICWREGL